LDTFELTIKKGRFTVYHGAPPKVSPHDVPPVFDLFSYSDPPECAVGPTIRVKPGMKFKIKVTNAMHGAPDPGADPNDSTMPNVQATAENIHGLRTTNLHTHGLHVSPAGNGDNIFRQIEPGDSFTFEYTIPADHPAGTFWYHPHKHGSTAYQLSNGLAGALIVEGDRPTDLDSLQAIKDMKERVVVLQTYTFGTYVDLVRNQTVGFIDASTLYNADEKNIATCEEIQPDPSTVQRAPQGSPGFAVLAVNGKLIPTFTIQLGEIQRWRVISASWDAPRQFAIYAEDPNTGTLNPTADFQINEVAVDGLTTGVLTVYSNDPNDKNLWTIAPGQRSDLLISAPAPNHTPSIKDGTVYYLVIPPGDDPTNNTTPLQVAKIKISGAGGKNTLPSAADLQKCAFNPVDLTTVQAESKMIPTANNSLLNPASTPDSQVGTPGTNTLSMLSSDVTHTYTLNGRSFHSLSSAPVQATLGKKQRWTIRVDENSDSGHPFHIHVNPFLVESITDASGNTTTPYVWRDTLFVDIGQTAQITHYFKRDKDNPLTGWAVLHCHILDHEDQGMMWPIAFSDAPPANAAKGAQNAAGPGPNPLLAMAAHQKLRPAKTPAPAIRLTNTAGRSFDLAQYRGRKVALVFFQGIRCGHCTQQLSRLLADARSSLGADTEMVAISSANITDIPKARSFLGVKDTDRLQICVDESQASFRAYGCYGTEARHGLFLIDATGQIRWRFIGDGPFDDTQLVVERLKTLPTVDPAREATIND
jgi:FtsP/CotA-like multicopper oxidase with cupredoxin domain/peroxiredoxin